MKEKFIEIFKCILVFAELRLREEMDFIENFAQIRFFAELTLNQHHWSCHISSEIENRSDTRYVVSHREEEAVPIK